MMRRSKVPTWTWTWIHRTKQDKSRRIRHSGMGPNRNELKEERKNEVTQENNEWEKTEEETNNLNFNKTTKKPATKTKKTPQNLRLTSGHHCDHTISL
jgi:hypothetical protein